MSESEIPCPSAKVLNVYKHDKTDDLGTEFDLSRIKISYSQLAPNEHKDFTIPSRTAHFTFVVQGEGQLTVESNNGTLSEWDCFGFPAVAGEMQFTIIAGKAGAQILTFGDRNAQTEVREGSSSMLPTIIHAREAAKPFGKGRLFGHIARLTDLSDIKKKDVPNTWNVNLEIVPPGAKTSEAHCHSHEEEFAFMLKGEARYWHHGQVPSTVLTPGDCVGWKPGTGIAHNLINDGVSHNEQGDPFIYLIFGEENPSEDRCFCPDRDINQRWVNRPNVPWGGASKEPQYPRPEELEE